MTGDARDGDGRAGFEGIEPSIGASTLFEQVAQRPQYLLACGHASYSVSACFDCLVKELFAREEPRSAAGTMPSMRSPRELKIAVTYPPHVLSFRIPRRRR